jgi:hypothetical protein
MRLRSLSRLCRVLLSRIRSCGCLPSIMLCLSVQDRVVCGDTSVGALFWDRFVVIYPLLSCWTSYGEVTVGWKQCCSFVAHLY